MAVFQVEVVMGTEDISGDDASEHGVVLIVVSSAGEQDNPPGVNNT